MRQQSTTTKKKKSLKISDASFDLRLPKNADPRMLQLPNAGSMLKKKADKDREKANQRGTRISLPPV